MEESTKELLKQCEMAWERGHSIGVFHGTLGTLLIGLLAKFIW